MKLQLINILKCPFCKKSFRLESFLEDDSEVIEGVLTCPCGSTFPIVRSIPRIVSSAYKDFPDFWDKYKNKLSVSPSKIVISKIRRRTQRVFGYQWTVFSKMEKAFKANFLNYIYPIDESFFKGKLGLDAGCGFGRHIFYAANFGAEMVGIDISEAIDSTYQNIKHLPNVHLVQCDVYNLPFKEESFDFIYSIGVLHHLPDPEAGFRCLLKILKNKSPLFIWVYSSTRKFANFLIEAVRKITRILPLKLILIFSSIMACIDWVFFILPYKFMLKLKIPEKLLQRIIYPRIRLYAQYPYEVSRADWFDRLSPPIRFYYSAEEIRKWFENMKMSNIQVSETGLYGWRGYGERDD